MIPNENGDTVIKVTIFKEVKLSNESIAEKRDSKKLSRFETLANVKSEMGLIDHNRITSNYGPTNSLNNKDLGCQDYDNDNTPIGGKRWKRLARNIAGNCTSLNVAIRNEKGIERMFVV